MSTQSMESIMEEERKIKEYLGILRIIYNKANSSLFYGGHVTQLETVLKDIKKLIPNNL